MAPSGERQSTSSLSSEELNRFPEAVENISPDDMRHEIELLNNESSQLVRANREMRYSEEGNGIEDLIARNEVLIRSNSMRVLVLEEQLRRLEATYQSTSSVSVGGITDGISSTASNASSSTGIDMGTSETDGPSNSDALQSSQVNGHIANGTASYRTQF